MDKDKKDNRINNTNKVSPLKNYLKYSTIGIQIFVVIAAFYYLGGYFDEKSGRSEPYYQNVMALLGVFLGVGSVVWQVIRDSKKQ